MGREFRARVEGGALQLRQGQSDEVQSITHALRLRRPDLGKTVTDEASAAYLAASFVAYAEDRHPEVAKQWCKVLQEVLDDAGTYLDEDDNEAAVEHVVEELIRKGVLEAKEERPEEGSVVMAVLLEDDQWHAAVVDAVLENDRYRIVFLEYGKPQEVLFADIQMMASVVDDEGSDELEEGTCEMCKRHMLLTFHHLIPKDTHRRYEGKRLPPGVEGPAKPTREFLNQYGTMICRKCHNFVHNFASNSKLATDYNTLEKLLANESIQRWVAWANRQRAGK